MIAAAEKANKLNDPYKLPVFQSLLEKRIIRSADDINSLFGTQEKVDRLNSVNFNLFQILLEKRIIKYTYNINSLFDTQENKNFMTNVINNPSLAKTILTMDGLVKKMGINVVNLINHSKYAESSGSLLINCQLALALLGNGAIQNITVDDLLDKNTVRTKAIELFSENTKNNKSVPPGLSKDILNKDLNFENNPMPKLQGISLVAFFNHYGLKSKD